MRARAGTRRRGLSSGHARENGAQRAPAIAFGGAASMGGADAVAVLAGSEVDGKRGGRLTSRSITLAALGAAGLTLAGSSQSHAQVLAGPPAATAKPRVSLHARHLNVHAGRRVFVRGTVRSAVAGLPVALEIQRAGRWRTLARSRTDARGAFRVRDRLKRPQSARARLRVGSTRRSLGRLNVYRTAVASWYGPGLYGSHLGCGGTLSAGRLGVAHKSLPCGTRLTIRHGRRMVRVSVIDRGPYVAGREFDLTAATAHRLGFGGHGTILTTR
jgi:rare lipoprotein A